MKTTSKDRMKLEEWWTSKELVYNIGLGGGNSPDKILRRAVRYIEAQIQRWGKYDVRPFTAHAVRRLIRRSLVEYRRGLLPGGDWFETGFEPSKGYTLQSHHATCRADAREIQTLLKYLPTFPIKITPRLLRCECCGQAVKEAQQ